MSLGVLNNISAIYAQNNLTTTQASLQKTLEELSSGSRINSGADDAAGLSIANGLAANSAALTQSSENATTGVGLLQVADGALSQVNSLLNRAITLATEASNGTLNTSQNAAAQQEYGDILSEINTIGSSTVFNGNSVFSSAVTNIFTSDGTQTGTNNYSVGVGTLNTTTGVGVTAPNSPSSGTSNTLSPIQVTAGTNAAVAYAASTAGKDVLNGLANVDNIQGSINIYVGTQAYNINTGAGGESVSNLSAQIQSAVGSAASVSLTTGTITITSATAGVANEISIGNNALYNTTGAAAVGSTVTAGTDATPYSVGSTSAVYNIIADNAADTFTNAGLTYTNSAGVTTNVAFTGAGGKDTIAQLLTNINTATGGGAVATNAGGVITITATASGSAAGFTLGGSVNDVLASGASTSSAAATAGQTLAGTNLNSQTSAASALLNIYTAINDISYQRGAVGANINTLTAVSNVETTQNVNVSSAQNAITATDYGAATSNLSKYEILSQTGISALAQANSVQQEVLKLLQ
jgi:flagellin